MMSRRIGPTMSGCALYSAKGKPSGPCLVCLGLVMWAVTRSIVGKMGMCSAGMVLL